MQTDEVIARIRDAWGAKRAGSRIQEAVEKTIDVAVRRNYVMQDGVWLTLPGVSMDDGTDCFSVAWIPYIRM